MEIYIQRNVYFIITILIIIKKGLVHFPERGLISPQFKLVKDTQRPLKFKSCWKLYILMCITNSPKVNTSRYICSVYVGISLQINLVFKLQPVILCSCTYLLRIIYLYFLLTDKYQVWTIFYSYQYIHEMSDIHKCIIINNM